MKLLKWILISVGAVAALLAAFALVFNLLINPAVMNEIRNNPNGEEAKEAMLLTYDNKTLPVNYLKEGNTVYMGVDGRWWRDFTDGGMQVSMLIQGVTYEGHGVAVLDDPAYVDDVFSRLRPTAPEWLPAWLNGKLIVITIDESSADS